MRVACDRCASVALHAKSSVPDSTVVNQARLIVDEPSPIMALETLSERPLGAVLSMVNVGLSTHPVVEELVNVPCALN